MFGKCVFRLLVVASATLVAALSSVAEIQLNEAWEDSQFPRVRTYPNHTGSGPNYAADFYFTERNHSDLYLNGEIPLADGLPGISILNAHSGYAYLLLYDLTVLGGGNFPWIDAERVIAGLDSIPRHSFSFDDMNEMRRRIDMEFVVDSLSWRSLYVHLQIDDGYFNLPGVATAVRQAIAELWNNTAPTCNSQYPRVAINLQTELVRGVLLGTSNNWGIAADEHLHFQVFEGEYFPSCLGAPLNLADANEVTMADQIILDSALVVGVPGCEGGTCFYYPAMVRQEFLPNDNVMIDAAWDGGSAANLRETPGGSIITALPNGTQGTLLTGPAVAALPDETYHVWWQCEFAAGTGWVAAEYISLATVSQEWTFFEGFDLSGFTQEWITSPPLPGPPIEQDEYLGAPSGTFEIVDADTCFRMSNVLPASTKVGISTALSLIGTEGEVEARINTLLQDYANSIDGFFELWILNSTDFTKYIHVTLFAGNYGAYTNWLYYSSIDGWGSSDLSWQDNTWYGVRITALDGHLTVSVWNDDGSGPLGIHEFTHSLDLLGTEFRIAFGQRMGGPSQPWLTESAVDYVAARIFSASSVPNPVSQPEDSRIRVGVYPTPSTSSVSISFAVAKNEHVRIRILDLLGRQVANLIDRDVYSGEHSLVWSGKDARGYRVAAGIYFLKAEVKGGTATQKIVFADVP